MSDYQEVRIRINPYSEDAADLLAAILAEIGYDSFVQEEDALVAYIPAENYSPQELNETLEGFPMQVSLTPSASFIEGKDWNEEWEKNYFKPIVVADRCVIHSTFHKDVPKAEYDIVIDPKMAFGTGHHSTTSLIIGYLLSMDLEGKNVIDMGTGTGILAILCMMRGAARAVGIEIDGDAYANALDNVRLNGVSVSLIHGDASGLPEAAGQYGADLLIANINRNIVLADMDSYVKALNASGQLIFSGFYEADIPLIARRAAMLGFEVAESRTDLGWAAVRLCRKSAV